MIEMLPLFVTNFGRAFDSIPLNVSKLIVYDQIHDSADIDDAAGLEHVFQVVRNRLSGSPTHPYNIHEILVGHQKLDPGYRFQIKLPEIEQFEIFSVAINYYKGRKLTAGATNTAQNNIWR
ncbi:MAG TPA: hypothetical protein VF089_19165 [Candidatus Binatia bacterium]